MSARPIRLDLADGVRRRSVAGALALSGAVLIAGWAGLRYVDVRSSHALLSAASAAKRYQEARPKANISPQQEKTLARQANALNDHITALNRPWEAVFRTVQPAGGMKVALLALEAAGQGRVLRLVAHADGPADMADYVSYLAEKGSLAGVYLVKHERLREGGYRFNVEARWREGH